MKRAVVVLCVAAVACSTSTTTDAPGPGGDLVLTDVSDLVERVGNGVVTVTSTQIQLDALLQPTEVPAGTGTGIVIDDQGHVLTNDHVITGARNVIVIGADGSQRDGVVVGTAFPDNDLALLLVEQNEGLEPIPLGSSSQLRVGDPVVAIGNALGLGISVSVGIVSALGRAVSTDTGPLRNLLQTDAAINPGNSGGPLLNAAGEVIGINTAVAGGAENIGFAILIDEAMPFVEAAVARQGQPYLGIQMFPNSPGTAAQFGLPVDVGVLVVEVFGGTPAADAGLRIGDIIVGIDGKEVGDVDDVVAEIERADVGATLALEVVRGRRVLEISATIRER